MKKLKNAQIYIRLLKTIFLMGIFICVVVIFLITPQIAFPTVFPTEAEYNPNSPIWVLSVLFWVLLGITGTAIIYGIYQAHSSIYRKALQPHYQTYFEPYKPPVQEDRISKPQNEEVDDESKVP